MLLAIFAAALAAIALYVRHLFGYWQRRGVPHLPYRIPFGHVTNLKGFHRMADLAQLSYDRLKDTGAPFAGLFMFHKPIVLVLQPELVKQILIKDFEYFQDRGLFYNPQSDPLSSHLFSMSGDVWRRMRGKMTPTFTSGKMKYMYPTMLSVADRLVHSLDTMIDTDAELECKELLSRFTTDIIGTCAFGIECNSVADPDAEFRQMGRSIFTKSRHGLFGALLLMTAPKLAAKLNMKQMRDDVIDFFVGVVEETVRHREANGIKRNDFMDMLIELKNQKGESGADGLSVGEMAAQVFLFFLAGFETSSTTMMFALFELSRRPDMQARVRAEVREVLAKHGGQFTYDAMMEMHYLEQVINETLRMYPPVGTLRRIATRDYPVPGTAHTLPKGIEILIPSHAIQHDAKHYEQPDRFDPERFAAAAKADRDPVSFLPFGQGPRNCIGLRFGMMQSRIGLVSLVNNYEIECAERMVLPLRYDPKGVLLSCEGGMWLKLTKLKKTD